MAIDYTDPIQTRGLRDHLISKGYKQSEIESLISRRAVAQNPQAYIGAGLTPEKVIEAAGGIGSTGGLKTAQYLQANAVEEVPELGEQERKFVAGYVAALKAKKLLDEGVKTGPVATTKSKLKEFVNQPDKGTSLRSQLSLAQTGIKSAFLGASQTDNEIRSLADAISNPAIFPEKTMKLRLEELISTIGAVVDPAAKKYAEEIVNVTAPDQTVSDMEVNSLLKSINEQKTGLGKTPGALPQTADTGLPPSPTSLVDNEMIGSPPPDLATIVLNQETAKKKETPLGEQDTFQRMLEGENLPHPAGIITNLPKSVASVIGGTVDAIVHPFRTAEAIIGTVAGGVEKLIPGVQRGEKFFDAYVQYLKGRYGNPDKFYTSLVNDPAGTALDIISIIDLGATSVKSLAKVGNLDDVAKGATVVQNAIAKADAVDQSLRGASYLAKRAPNEVTIGLPYSTKNFKPEVAALAKELDMDLPASALTESRIVRNAEAIAQNMVFGGKVSQKILQSENKLRELGQRLKSDVFQPIDDLGAGNIIKNTFDEYIKKFRETKNELYNSLDLSRLKVSANPENTLKTLQSIVDEQNLIAGEKPYLGYYKQMLDDITKQIEDGTFQVANTMETKKAVGSALYPKSGRPVHPVATGDKGTMSRLYASLAEDLDMQMAGIDPAFAEAVKTVNAYYAQTIKNVNERVGQTINRSNPEKIVSNIFKPNSQTDIMMMKELMGENFQAISEVFFHKILAESLDAKNGIIDINKLRRNVDKYGFTTLAEGLEIGRAHV